MNLNRHSTPETGWNISYAFGDCSVEELFAGGSEIIFWGSESQRSWEDPTLF